MPSSPTPLPVERALRKVGQNLALVLSRRQLSQDALAKSIGAAVNTVRRMENGHPGTALHYFARRLQVFGELEQFEQLIDTALDASGLVLMNERLPKRIRTRRAGGG